MVLTMAFILWLVMLCLVVNLMPLKWQWARLLLWTSLSLLSYILTVSNILHFKM